MKNGKFINLPNTLKNGPGHLVPDYPEIKKLIQPMAQANESLASKQASVLKQFATDIMLEKLSSEIQRLESLAKVNATIRPEELSLLKKEQRNLKNCLDQARVRLDSIRLIWRGSMERLRS